MEVWSVEYVPPHPTRPDAAAGDNTVSQGLGIHFGSSIMGSVTRDSRPRPNDPATGTVLYAIDASRDVLTVFIIPSGPNSGKMTVAGPLGVDTGPHAGFDIAGSDNIAYAALSDSPSGKSTLYRIDLTSGAATRLRLLAQTKAPLIGIAVAP